MNPKSATPISPALRPVLELEGLLQEMLVEHLKLLKHLDSQQEAMKRMNVKEMETARNQQEASRMRVNTMEQRRKLLVQQIARINQLPGEPKIPALAALYPQRKQQLMKLRSEIEMVMKEVAAKSFIASKLASAVLGHLNTAMRLLAGAVGGAGIYTNRGVAKVARRIGVMEAVG